MRAPLAPPRPGRPRRRPRRIAMPAAPRVPVAMASGIWASRSLALSGKAGRVDQFIRQTTSLAQAGRGMRDLLFAALRRDSAQGDQLTQQAGPVDAAQLAQQQVQLQALTGQFRQITAALVPLAKISVLLGQYQNDLSDWRDSVHRQYLQDAARAGHSSGGAGAHSERGGHRIRPVAARRQSLRARYAAPPSTAAAAPLRAVVRHRPRAGLDAGQPPGFLRDLRGPPDRGHRRGHAECDPLGGRVLLPDRQIRYPRGRSRADRRGARRSDRCGPGAHVPDGAFSRRADCDRPRRGIFQLHRLPGDRGAVQADSRRAHRMARADSDAGERQRQWLVAPAPARRRGECPGSPQGRIRAAESRARAHELRTERHAAAPERAPQVPRLGSRGHGSLPRGPAFRGGHRRGGLARAAQGRTARQRRRQRQRCAHRAQAQQRPPAPETAPVPHLAPPAGRAVMQGGCMPPRRWL